MDDRRALMAAIIANPDEDTPRLGRCENLFEDFCIVTQSVRRGIPVNVTVKQREVTAA